MRFSTRVFLLAFAPTAALLLAGLWTLQALVESRVREGLGRSLRDTHRLVSRLRQAYEAQSDSLVATVADNAALKAGFELVATEADREAARLTLEDQLTVSADELGFDLIAATDANEADLAALLRSDGALGPVPAPGLRGLGSGLAMYEDGLYFVNSAPVAIAGERIGTLTVGRLFDLSALGAPVLVTKEAAVVRSNLPAAAEVVVGQGLAECGTSPDCEVWIGDARFVMVALDDMKIEGGLVLRSLQSVDEAGSPIQAVVHEVFFGVGAATLLAALGFSWIVARSVVTPLREIVGRMEDRLASSRYAGPPLDTVAGDADLEGLVRACGEWMRQVEVYEKDLEAAIERRTEQLHRANTELVSAMDRVLEADRLKGEFLANISHEIRTPLNVILGMTELAQEAATDSRQSRYLEMVRKSGESLLRIVSDLLDFSRLEAGGVEIRPEVFGLPGLFSELAEIYTSKAAAKGLRLVCEVAPEGPLWVVADEERIKQVLVNLIDNAIKFTHEGSIDVRVDREGCGQNELRFSVWDTGVGISQDRRDLIFERFQQGDHSASASQEGVGLGLAISQSLVQLMGGKLWLENPKDGGNAFHFTVTVRAAMQPRAGSLAAGLNEMDSGKGTK